MPSFEDIEFFPYINYRIPANVGTVPSALLGVTGQVLMNNKAIRVPSYATYYVKNGTMRIVVELTARLSDKHKCAMSENDCSEHVREFEQV